MQVIDKEKIENLIIFESFFFKKVLPKQQKNLSQSYYFQTAPYDSHHVSSEKMKRHNSSKAKW